MRDKITALYYPDFQSDPVTLIKAILLFDEIHYMDRPSFTFYLKGKNDNPLAERVFGKTKPAYGLGGLGSSGGFGLIGASSPVRHYEPHLRHNGVPLYVHPAPGGPVYGEFLEAVTADITDKNFLSTFQNGLRTSQRFLELHVPNGLYANGETQTSISKKLTDVDLQQFPDPLETYLDTDLAPFEFLSDKHTVKNLLMNAIHCSAKINFALNVSSKHGFSPLADAAPYSDLLSVKYRRAVKRSEKISAVVPATDMSIAILDELVPPETLYALTLGDVVKYRKESEHAREAFLEHLVALHSKTSAVPADGDYGQVIKKLIDTEIRPAATEFRNQMTTIHEKLFGSIVKGAIGGTASAAAAQLFGDFSWPRLCGLAGAAGLYLAHQAIDAFLEGRKAHRECAISYLLNISKD